jgi:hypothetical protein
MFVRLQLSTKLLVGWILSIVYIGFFALVVNNGSLEKPSKLQVPLVLLWLYIGTLDPPSRNQCN